ncbi:hypothetical protein C8Q78DRAFT_500978 [Trametes maxima]|nr:hypothetical protein C8Q78DRAFT_500978 [Trametes maxima]
MVVVCRLEPTWRRVYSAGLSWWEYPMKRATFLVRTSPTAALTSKHLPGPFTPAIGVSRRRITGQPASDRVLTHALPPCASRRPITISLAPISSLETAIGPPRHQQYRRS